MLLKVAQLAAKQILQAVYHVSAATTTLMRYRSMHVQIYWHESVLTGHKL